jgi:hypothetical protein
VKCSFTLGAGSKKAATLSVLCADGLSRMMWVLSFGRHRPSTSFRKATNSSLVWRAAVYIGPENNPNV